MRRNVLFSARPFAERGNRRRSSATSTAPALQGNASQKESILIASQPLSIQDKYGAGKRATTIKIPTKLSMSIAASDLGSCVAF